RLFITAGRQPIRWGTGRFWNPTDFLNRQFRDPLAVFDERLGVGLVKFHFPIESLGWNLYAIAEFEGASSLGDVGAAVRAEMLYGQTEVSLTAVSRRNEPLQLGADLSAGVGPFEIRAETALLYDDPGPFYRFAEDSESPLILLDFQEVSNRLGLGLPDAFRAVRFDHGDWVLQTTLGAELQLAYGDRDSAYLGVEYFYFSEGQIDPRIYPALVLLEQYEPLYAARNYVGAYLALPNPGPWDHTNFTASTLANLSDQSFLSRLDVDYDFLGFATVNAYFSFNWGRQGEFRFQYELQGISGGGSAPSVDLSDFSDTQLALSSVLTDGVVVNAPRFNAGLGLRMNW
ncbi:MAG: hypothetical protein AAF658_17265, partial [Myxococcota bacterium]